MNASETILIIDDERLFRMNLRSLLEDMGYRVLEATSGQEGLDRAAAEGPDLVLMDVRMPGMDGFEVCARLKADASTRAIPVIFLSGVLDAHEVVKAFQVGGVDYVTKPFYFEEVEARVRTQLELVQSHRRLEEQNRTLHYSLEATDALNRRLVEVNELLSRSEALKGQFLSTMRNEINNPLNSLLALGEELGKGPLSTDRDKLIGGLISREAFGLDFQIRNIFCAAELEAGDVFPSITTVDAVSVVRDVIDALGHQARDKGVALLLEAPDPRCSQVRTDGEMLRIIAANLVSNGLKFSLEGGPVRIRLRLEERALVLEVEDEGIGLKPEDRSMIFERFRQLDSGTSRAHQGQGLGLSIVQALVDLMGGRIAVASEPGKGSRFTCTLPEGELQEMGGTLNVDGNLFYFGDAEEVL